MNRQHTFLLERLESSAADLATYLSRLSEQELQREPAPGEWSLHAIAAHLRDTDKHVFLYRVRRILDAAEPPQVANFDQEEWHLEHYSPGEPLKNILGDFRRSRRALVRRLRETPDRDWARYAIHPIYGKISLEWLALHAYNHTLGHLHQALIWIEDAVLDKSNSS
jgi:hypothetical protein